MPYVPNPIDTSRIVLSKKLLNLTEILAKDAHDIWAQQRISEGWKWGPQRNDKIKTHPNLIPFNKLPESEKEYDRRIVTELLKAIIVLGYDIQKL